MTRLALTTPSGKAKCLTYRDGKRCGRLGRYLVKGVAPDTHGRGRHQNWQHPCCEQCKENMLVEQGGEVVSFSPRGYTVIESLFGPVQREYTPIERVCVNCERVTLEHMGETDRWCRVCGQSITEMEQHERNVYAQDNMGEGRW